LGSHQDLQICYHDWTVEIAHIPQPNWSLLRILL